MLFATANRQAAVVGRTLPERGIERMRDILDMRQCDFVPAYSGRTQSYYSCDELIVGNNPYLTAISLLVAARGGKTVVVLPTNTKDDWDYQFMKPAVFRRWVERALHIPRIDVAGDTETDIFQAWSERFFEVVAREVSRQPDGTAMVLNRMVPSVSSHSPEGEVLIFLSPETVDALPLSPRSDAMAAADFANQNVARHVLFNTLPPLSYPIRPGQYNYLFAKHVTVTSRLTGFAESDPSGKDGNAFSNPLVQGVGSAVMMHIDPLERLKEAFTAVLRACGQVRKAK
ncbi:hypothetical protein [Thalassospira xiamenensis]|nr:hypothetical protein [Thalassospira xiamenensis]